MYREVSGVSFLLKFKSMKFLLLWRITFPYQGPYPLSPPLPSLSFSYDLRPETKEFGFDWKRRMWETLQRHNG